MIRDVSVGPHKSGKCSYHYAKMSFKHSTAEIQFDPAILAAIGHHFIAK